MEATETKGIKAFALHVADLVQFFVPHKVPPAQRSWASLSAAQSSAARSDDEKI